MDNFMRKNIGSRPKKRQKKGFFLGFSHFTARKRFTIQLCCSNDAQTHRIVARSNVKGEKKQKLSHKAVVKSYLPLQKFQGSDGADFRFVKF